MAAWIRRFIDFLLAARWPLFAFAIVAGTLAFGPSQRVRFDRTIENMFAKDDPLLPPYQRLKDRFGGNEVVMAVYHDDDLFAASGRGIERLASISAELKAVPGIQDVLSLAEINGLLDQLEATKRLANPLNLFAPRNAAPEPAILNANSPLAIRFRELFAGYTHSTDGKTAAIVCMLTPVGERAPKLDAAAELDPRSATLKELKRIVGNLPEPLKPGVLAGEPVMISAGFALLEQDGRRLGFWTMSLMGLTILALFWSLRWLVIPLVVVQWSLILTQASLVLSGLELSMVSSMLPAIVTVVGVAGVMHFIVRVREFRTQGLTQRAALSLASWQLAGPMLGAILTTVGGFGSLWWASVEPVRDFGTMMVVGSFLVLPAICCIVPALALVAARDQTHALPAWSEVHMGFWLMRSVDWIRARPRTVALCAIAIAVLASLGALRLEVETDFTHNFRRGSNIVQAYDFVETHLGGAGVWDVVIPAPHTLDREYLARVRRLQEKLRGIELSERKGQKASPGLTKVISLVDALDAVDAEPTLAALTSSPEVRNQALAAAMPTFMAALRSSSESEPAKNSLRIMLRARERQSADQKRRLINEVTRLALAEFPPTENSAGAEVTGFFVLLTNLIESILRDQWVTFGVSSAAISAMVWVGFRSWKYALIAMIPNAVPIYIVMGLLGWAGLKMNMGAAMIAAVSMGMSVDSSIHYFSAFRRARRAGKTVHAALAECQQSVGLAMIFTTVALIVGFAVLITSEFIPTVYFGALMSLAMLGGMLGNLIVLPLLLAWTERDSAGETASVPAPDRP